jgi:xylene monooxygenase electron transfer component
MFGFFKNKKQDYSAKINGSQTLTIKAGDNLLKAALEADIAWPHDCRVGSCGTCKCRLVEGKIKPLADFAYTLEAEDLQNNFILACQTALKTDIEVEVELLADGQQQHHWESDAVIKEIRDLTHDIKELVVEINDPGNDSASELLYHAGQYADLKIPNLKEGRNYSFATAPHIGQKEFLFYIRKVPGGEFTEWLFEEDRTGQTIIMSGPYGKFGLAEEPATMTCVAGGSGMSAIVGVLQAALEAGVKRDVRFVFGARTQKDLYLDDLIAQMAADWQSKGLGSFDYIPCLSQEPEDSSWQGERGSCIDHIVVPESKSVSGQAYLCGPPGMIDAAISIFESNGIKKDAIFFDKFLDKSNTHLNN